MSFTTSVPRPVLGPNGYIAPEESAILTGVQADMNSAFGGDLNPGLNTPQGQLASSTTAIIGDGNDQFVLLTNNVDPAYSSGRMQDAIARIYFLERNPAQSTVVTCTCSGAPGVIITIGAIAQAQDGNLYGCTQSGTIPSSGSIDLTFACSVTGPIACPADSVDTIYQSIPGWDSVNNATEGAIGNDVESRANFEFRRQNTVAANSVAQTSSILGAVLKVAGVLDAYVYDNSTGSPVTVLGVIVAAKTIYVAVVGGLTADVAQAIWSKKSPGCGYTGSTTVTVYDTNPAYPPPGIPYSVSFDIPAGLAIYFTVEIANNPGIPANAATLIQNAIIAAFAGADGGPRARTGWPILTSRFYTNVTALGSWAQLLSIQIGSANSLASAFTASSAGTTLTVSAVGSGALAVGQPIFGTSVMPGTVIVQQLSGSTGGAGTYKLSIAQTIGSEAMGSLTLLNTLTTNINQEPTIAAANIAVLLV